MVEAAATTIGTVARSAGFVFRADASGVGPRNGMREVAVLYEADADDLADRFPAMEEERGQPCVDLWVYWSPDAGALDISAPESMHRREPHTGPIVDGPALRSALTEYAADLSGVLGLDPT